MTEELKEFVKEIIPEELKDAWGGLTDKKLDAVSLGLIGLAVVAFLFKKTR